MSLPNNSPNQPAKNLKDDVAAAIANMIYISESEAPLELMPWTGVTDLPSLQRKIGEQMRLPPAEQTIGTAADFLAEIHRMADPADPVIMDYVKTYDKLFELLRAHSKEMAVVRAGKGEVHVFIAALGAELPVIIHATAIET